MSKYHETISDLTNAIDYSDFRFKKNQQSDKNHNWRIQSEDSTLLAYDSDDKENIPDLPQFIQKNYKSKISINEKKDLSYYNM